VTEHWQNAGDRRESRSPGQRLLQKKIGQLPEPRRLTEVPAVRPG
jgi:hypothetical protein